jgi:integrase
VYVELVGKGKRIRTVPIPPFVKVAIDAWTAAAGLSDGPLFRRVRRREYPEKTPTALSERMIWHIVTKYARQTGLVDKLAPHDMRRTCAKLCRDSGGDSNSFNSCWATPPSRLPNAIWDRGRT